MKTILIADDSWIARRGIGSYIGSDNWRIIEAENGNEALSKIEQEAPHLHRGRCKTHPRRDKLF